ncbi:hypothetical protein ACO1MN_16615, partial [Staphylococcus aureus]
MNPEPDPRLRRVLGDGRMIDAVGAAVRRWQRPPTRSTPVDTAWGTVVVDAAEWAEVFEGVGVVSHNELRT